MAKNRFAATNDNKKILNNLVKLYAECGDKFSYEFRDLVERLEWNVKRMHKEQRQEACKHEWDIRHSGGTSHPYDWKYCEKCKKHVTL